jgi:hypothetical protein
LDRTSSTVEPFPKWTVGAFLALAWLALYLFLQGGKFHNLADEWFPYAATESLVKHADLDMNAAMWASTTGLPFQRFGRDGNLYPIYSPLQSAIGAPLYAIALLFPSLGLARMTLLANGVVSAITNVLVFTCVRRLGYQSKVALSTMLAYGVGTIALVYAKSYFSEPLSALGLLLMMLCVLRWEQTCRAHYITLAGLGLGLLVLNRPTYFLAVPCCLVYVAIAARRCNLRPTSIVRACLAFLSSFGACLAILGFTDWWRFGNAFDMGYGDQAGRFDTPFLVGFVGQLFSPGKGVFVFCPILLFSLLGAIGFWKRNRTFATIAGVLVLAVVCVYAPWHAWFGGSHAWGPRYVLPVLPLAVLPAAQTFESAFKRSNTFALPGAVALLVISSTFQFGGAVFDYIPYVDRLFSENHVDTFQEDTQLVPVYFDVGNVQVLHQFAYVDARYSDVAWRMADGERANGTLWSVLFTLGGFALLCVGLALLATTDRLGAFGLPVLVLATALLPAITAYAFVRYDGTSPRTPLRDLYSWLSAEALPGDGLVTVSIDATSAGFLYDASPARHFGLGRQDALPITPAVRALLELQDARTTRTWIIEEGSPDRIEDWIAAGSDRRVVASDANARLVLLSHPTPSLFAAEATFDNRMRLTGYSTGEQLLRPGSSLGVDLFWLAIQTPTNDQTVFVHVLDSTGKVVAQHDGPPRGGMAPTRTWQAGERVRDRHVVPLPARLPPGPFRLSVGLYDPRTGVRASAESKGVRWRDDEVPLITLNLAG